MWRDGVNAPHSWAKHWAFLVWALAWGKPRGNRLSAQHILCFCHYFCRAAFCLVSSSWKGWDPRAQLPVKSLLSSVSAEKVAKCSAFTWKHKIQKANMLPSLHNSLKPPEHHFRVWCVCSSFRVFLERLRCSLRALWFWGWQGKPQDSAAISSPSQLCQRRSVPRSPSPFLWCLAWW